MLKKRECVTIKQLLILLLGIIPIGYQIVNVYNLNSNWIYLGFIIINVLFLFKLKGKIPINKKVLFISGNFIIAYILIPILFNTIGNVNLKNSILYMGLFLLFINALTIITLFLKKEDYKNILISTLIGNSLFLVFMIFLNINQINSGTVLSIITGNRPIRADFSFGHPNTAAMFIFIEILLIYLIFIDIFNKKIMGNTLIVMFILPLLATGSRTSLYSLLLFFVLELYRKKIYKIKSNYKKFFVFTIVLPVGIFLLSKFDLTTFLNSSSGRNEFVKYNINYIMASNRLIMGFGPTPVTSMRDFLPELVITDTWYITHILSFGIISLGIIMVNIIYLLIIFIKNINVKNGHVISLIIVLLFYSGAENVLFIPGTIISWFFWMIIYLELKFINSVD